jgi:hypothetical protein
MSLLLATNSILECSRCQPILTELAILVSGVVNGYSSFSLLSCPLVCYPKAATSVARILLSLTPSSSSHTPTASRSPNNTYSKPTQMFLFWQCKRCRRPPILARELGVPTPTLGDTAHSHSPILIQHHPVSPLSAPCPTQSICFAFPLLILRRGHRYFSVRNSSLDQIKIHDNTELNF